jgi:acetyl esterase/lipase
LTTTGAFQRQAIAERVAAIGTDVTPEALAASQAVYEPFHEREPYEGVRVQRDLPYGPDPRQRLDVFAAADDRAGASRPVVVFVHGGGFVAGDKRRPGTPYNDNVALWAVRNGAVGVTMTYRLAPVHRWPAGALDVGAALGWLMAGIGASGGDPDRIWLMGTSAGAVHVATCVALPELGAPIPAGIILLSGAYDFATFDPEILRPYLGDDDGRYAERSPMRGLVEARVPTLVALAEHDPPGAQQQALALVTAHWRRHGRWPAFVRLPGHNHFTTTAHLNSPDDSLGRFVLPAIDLG